MIRLYGLIDWPERLDLSIRKIRLYSLNSVYQHFRKYELLVLGLDLVAKIYSHLACFQVQPVLFKVMDRFQSNVAVMERCCRCIRFAIRVLGKNGVFALPSLAEKVRFVFIYELVFLSRLY